MMVPVSLAVARRFPSLLSAMKDKGARWASMTFTAFKVRVSYMRTSPEGTGAYSEGGGAWEGRLSWASSRGFGKG